MLCQGRDSTNRFRAHVPGERGGRALRRPCRERSFALVGALLLALVLPLGRAFAIERVVRLFDERDGLTVAEISELAQDSRGFVWIGTMGGLTRFDGSEMRAWAPDLVRHALRILSTGPNGEVVVAGIDEPLRRVTTMGVEAIPGPGGRLIVNAAHAAISDDGALWVAKPDSLCRRGPDGAWRVWSATDFDSTQLSRIQPADNGSIFVATRSSIWFVDPSGAAKRVATIPLVSMMARLPDGTLVCGSWRPGRVWRLDPTGPRVVYEWSTGIKGLATRGHTIWAQLGERIVGIPESGPARVISPVPTLPNGRPLLVDREGTLWIGGFRGLMALPEPETVAWNELDGLPTPAHAHHLCRAKDAVYVITWAGTVRVDLSSEPRKIVPAGRHSGRMREDPQGRLWSADIDKGFLCIEGSRELHYSRPGVHGLYGTAPRPDGRMWLSTDDGLFLTPLTEGPPHQVRGDPPVGWAGPLGTSASTPTANRWTDSWLGPVLEDHRGRLWVGRDEEIWSCAAESLAIGAQVSWTREELPGSELVVELVELPDGTVWAATNNTGLLEHSAAGWRPLPGNRHFESLRAYGMDYAPSGGVWVLMAGTLARVLRRPDLPDGFEIVERLTSWQGLPTQQAGDIHEDPDGRLWLASLAGLVEVPPGARRFTPEPPPVELVEVEVDGVPQSLDATIRLPWRRNRLGLRFAALSYRDRNRLLYQVRTEPSQSWQEMSEPSFRFVDVAPGRYHAELRASLDGERWTDPPMRLAFEVGRPWWQEIWALAAFACAAAAALYAAHRIRVGMLLRLERQRVRIAMDLHDEVGSGLGSIGILAGLAADASLDEPRRRALAARIADTAGELGGALGDIVRSLRQGTDSLESFGQRLGARARRLVPGDRPLLKLAFPERWPSQRLEPEVQRQLQAIASEALHNAARHADAKTIELGLREESGIWRLWVRDDGTGMASPAARPGTGHGLPNMRERARSIGAELEIREPPGGGAVVEVRFEPERRKSPRTNMRVGTDRRS